MASSLSSGLQQRKFWPRRSEHFSPDLVCPAVQKFQARSSGTCKGRKELSRSEMAPFWYLELAEVRQIEQRE